MERCHALDLIVFSTPFDETAVDFLETLHVPCYKIASLEIVDLPLIRKAAQTKKPLIISTGAANLIEIGEAVKAAREAGCQELILLKCTSSYPALAKDAHVRTIPHLAAAFDVSVGLSDHTIGMGVSLAAVAWGACLIEKHVTLNRLDGGVDSAFSLEPTELQMLVKESKQAWEALGHIQYTSLLSEQTSRSHRPSLFFVQDIQPGETIQPHHIRSVRPNSGLPIKEEQHIIGLKVERFIKAGTPVTWDVFKS
jgi:N-acetylneuraminate synthase